MRTRFSVSLLVVVLLAAAVASAAVVRPSAASVIVNGDAVPEETLVLFTQYFGWRIPDGAYWYDAICGAWGNPGGPTRGFIQPFLPLGAVLRADASGGGDGRVTGIFINGREIHPEEAFALGQLVSVTAGRYWLDAQGNAGYEGGPAVVNLYQLAVAQRGANGGGYGGGYNHSGPGGHTGSDGDTFYYFDPESGASVMNNGY